MHPADPLVVVAHLFGRRAAGDPVLGHTEIDAGAEGPALGLDHQDADVVAEADTVGQHTELAGGLPAPGVELVRQVVGEGGDAAGLDTEGELPLVLGQDRFGADRHSGLGLPTRLCWRRWSGPAPGAGPAG